MRTRSNDFGQRVPAPVWRLNRAELLALLDDATSPDRYSRRRVWVEEHVAPSSPAYLRVLLRNSRSWPEAYDGEPDFCWRMQALVEIAERRRCSFLFDVFDATLARHRPRRSWRRGPDFESAHLLGANDLS